VKTYSNTSYQLNPQNLMSSYASEI